MAKRLKMEIRGAVQGVGFRPFVYRLATSLGLSGWVLNDIRGVFLEVEGDAERLSAFRERLRTETPPRARIQELAESWLEPVGDEGFRIRTSEAKGIKTVLVLPDIATCPECLNEVLDPGNRRHLYPFANCTNCGPRFTIVKDLPYDRPNTTMRGFALCPDCRAEYENPLDRRFHAQPTACPACGPELAAWTRSGDVLARGDEALAIAADVLLKGEVLACKGLGGFHLMCDARDEASVSRLRARKAREDKPFALMVKDLAAARELAEISPEAATLLESAEAPIVLLPRLAEAAVARAVAPGRPELGLMLPATPLHHLLLRAVGAPLVATSGNLSEEPICTDELEALSRLSGLADAFLVHDRPIERHADDSIIRIAAGAPRVLRRARGYAPLPVAVAEDLPVILAVGAHMKTAVALGLGGQVFLSQHIGDLETPEAMNAFRRVIADFLRLYEARPALVAHDLHPGYPSTLWAVEWAAEHGIPSFSVQHHHAHLASCLAENGAPGPALGVTWDGTGYGTDGTVWGGEFLKGDAGGFTRFAHLRPFRLPGGEAAVREPRRAALAVLFEIFGGDALSREDLAPVRAFAPKERTVLAQMLETGLNAPLTTSAGRLFDAVAALLGLSQRTRYEGQAAMALEAVADPREHGAWPLPLVLCEGAPAVLDWEPLLRALLEDLANRVNAGRLAARFHNSLVDGIARTAGAAGEPHVALTGGCFQNRLLLERAAERLSALGFEVLLHREVPPNDGGISLGQVLAGARHLKHLHRVA
ncbi:MAG TPA: carbamoyltransferase HypF [Thermoanaerobaculia bacterium]|nr:carbamoyltransferase HypF [Thermoanaerobaculia bacterium]